MDYIYKEPFIWGIPQPLTLLAEGVVHLDLVDVQKLFCARTLIIHMGVLSDCTRTYLPNYTGGADLPSGNRASIWREPAVPLYVFSVRAARRGPECFGGCRQLKKHGVDTNILRNGGAELPLRAMRTQFILVS